MSETCSQMEPLLPEYALGNLPVDERKRVDDHIGECPACSTALAEYQQVAEGFLHSVPAATPSPRVRASLIAALGAEASAPSRKTSFQWRSSLIYAVGASLVALVTLNVILLVQSAGLRTDINSLVAQQRSDQRALALANNPLARQVEVVGESALGTLVFDPDGQVAVVYLAGLDPLPTDQAYQAWLISPDGSRTSGGLLRPEPGSELAILVIDSPQPLRVFTGFGMTIEPSGGSPGPTGIKVVGAEL